MSQEITIIVLVDIKASLEKNSLEDNIYLIDNLRTEGSKGEGTKDLVTAINGDHWCDGLQASEIVLNWLPIGIGSLPLNLPRNYHEKRTKEIDEKLLKYLKKLKNGSQDKNIEHENLKHVINEADVKTKIRDKYGKIKEHGTRLLTLTGEHYHENHEVPNSYLTPILNDITGEAVEKGVMYPAQYGTPVAVKDGWYWSATADTSKTGIYNYTLHIILHRLSYIEGSPVWEPVKLTHDSKIDVSSFPKKNGFSNSTIVELPI